MTTHNFLTPILLAALISGCATSSQGPVSDTLADASSGKAAGMAGAGADIRSTDIDGTDSAGGVGALGERTIYFTYDSAMVSRRYDQMLKAHADNLQRNPKLRMLLTGHADDRGSTEYNLALGQRRSDAVLRALTGRGAPEAKIEAVSYGEERPRAGCPEERCWRENRRVDISYPRWKQR